MIWSDDSEDIVLFVRELDKLQIWDERADMGGLGRAHNEANPGAVPDVTTPKIQLRRTIRHGCIPYKRHLLGQKLDSQER